MSASSRYEVLARIATGGMASVFVGRFKAQLGVSRLVALKRPHPFILADPRLRRSVIEEARTASAIHHANVVSVVDVELLDGEPLLVLEYVEGATLSELIRHAAETASGGAFAPIAMRILLDTARGLQAAHALGILHRDVTPQNVLVGVDGVARLSDFGIAKSAAHRAEPSVTDSVKGKLGYLAPEYLSAKAFVVASDLFSLAVVAWEALTARRLFGGGSDVETFARVVALERPSLVEIAPALAPFEPVLARALAREPGDRPGSVAAFASELEEVAEQSIGVASPAEVAAFVASACGEELAARRAALAASQPRPVEEMDQLPLRAPSARDEIATASITDGPVAPAALVETAEPPPLAPARRRHVALGAALAVGLVVLAAAAVVTTRGSTSTPAALPVAAAPSATGGPASTTTLPPGDVAPPLEASAQAAPGPRTNTRARPGNRGAVPKPAGSANGAPAFPTHAPPNPYAR